MVIEANTAPAVTLNNARHVTQLHHWHAWMWVAASAVAVQLAK
jgi:hypothetical protein